MVNPRTVNGGIIVPLTGADVDLWGEQDVNPNMVAIDGFLCGVQPIAVTGAAPKTLTSPAGFTATPSPGPTEAQNRVLRFTGLLTADQSVTLPLPGVYVIENLTTGPFSVIFHGAVASTEVIATPPGTITTIYTDGSVVRFVDLGKMGEMEFWAGLIQLPAWVLACTIQPYLRCNGGIASSATFPFLSGRLANNFGGDGVTTFGVPDMRGRYPLDYDGTGARVTVAGCGLNGTVMGAAQDAQNVTLTTPQIPSHYHATNIFDPGHVHLYKKGVPGDQKPTSGGTAPLRDLVDDNTGSSLTGVRTNSPNGLDTTFSAGGGQPHNNMPNTQVAGIWVIKT